MNVEPEERSVVCPWGMTWLRDGRCLSYIISPRLCCSLKVFPGSSSAHLAAITEFVFIPLGGLWQSQEQPVLCRVVPQPSRQCWRLKGSLCPLVGVTWADRSRVRIWRHRAWVEACGSLQEGKHPQWKGPGREPSSSKEDLARKAQMTWKSN